MSVAYLPPTVALKSNWFNLYLNYSDDSYSSTQGFVKFNGSDVFSRLAKFEVLTANTGTGLVHIRCRKNKKFLRRMTATSAFLSPDAAEPEEDQSKWGCTLFQPQLVEASNTDKVYFFHVQSQQYAIAWDVETVRSLRLYSSFGHQCVFDILDLESLVILPKYVAFKGPNGKYLKVGASTSSNLTFSSTDKGNSECGFEVYTDGHGRAQIRSSHNNRYLRLNTTTNWILADSVGGTTDVTTLFWPLKVDNGTVAFRSLSNDKFCCQHTSGDVTDGLSVVHASTSTGSRLTLEELVHERRIYNTDFDLANSIIYGETPLTMATASATNNTSKDNTVEFRLTYTESRSTTWTSSHSWMVGISVSTSFKIPFIGGGDVTAEAEYSGSYEWGETITSENTLETTHTFPVPAHSSISVGLLATQGTCDVPYSYYQQDLLYNGNREVFQKFDGVCTGINAYNFQVEVTRLTTVREPGSKTGEPTTTVEKIHLPELSVPPTSLVIPTTSREQALPVVQLDEEIAQGAAAALPLESSQEGGETVA